jgi:hypothetical protein
METEGRATSFEFFYKKNKKPNVKLNILDEGYPYKNKGIA